MEVEFCIFISACKSLDITHSYDHDRVFCKRLSEILNKPDVNGNFLFTEPCCPSGEISNKDHSKHYIKFKVPQIVLKKCISAMLNEGTNEISAEKFSSDANAFLNNLTYGQTVQIANLSLGLIHLSRHDLISLNELNTGSYNCWPYKSEDFIVREAKEGANGRYFEFSDQCILILKGYNFISEPVVCHSSENRRKIVSNFAGIVAPFFAVRRFFSNNKKNDQPNLNSSFVKSIFPPVSAIRAYLGDSIGAYFSWMLSYLILLSLPACLEISLTFFPALLNSIFSSELIDNRPDSWLRIFYGWTIVLWGFVCIKIWYRQKETLTFEWTEKSDSKFINYCASTNLNIRPDFKGTWRINPVTTDMEFYYPTNHRKFLYLISFAITLLCLMLATLINVILLNLEGYMDPEDTLAIEIFGAYGRIWINLEHQNENPIYKVYVSVIGIMHPLVIYVINQVIFRKIAEKLTHLENHKTQNDFETALVVKRFLFEAIDAYGCLLYLGLCKNDWLALRAMVNTMFATDSVRRITLECLIPYFSYKISQKNAESLYEKAKKEDSVNSLKKFRKEFYADVYDPFDDYLEMILQNGYIVLFAMANPPFIPLAACICNWIEMNSDMLKMLYVVQRPIPKPFPQCQDVWLALLTTQACIGVITNLSLLYARDFISISSFIIIENIFIIIVYFFYKCISNEPVGIRDLRRCKAVQIKRQLERRISASSNFNASI